MPKRSTKGERSKRLAWPQVVVGFALTAAACGAPFSARLPSQGDAGTSGQAGDDAGVVGLHDGVSSGGAPGSVGRADSGATDSRPNELWHRDWNLHPALFRQSGAARLWGLSDVHGDRDRLLTLLSAAGLISQGDMEPLSWTGGTDTLVVSGDSIDKGPQSVEVLDAWLTLIPQAEALGGHLVVLLGNHEAEFLADPFNDKAQPLVAEIGNESPSIFAGAESRYGRFMRERPIAAIVDGWYFSHAGNSGGRSAAEIEAAFQKVVDADAWNDSFLLDSNSILEARNWWPAKDTNAFLDGYLTALAARHIVFGHRPITFSDPPSGNVEVHQQGRLVLIDVGMSRAVDYSTGKLLRIDGAGTPAETASMVTAAGDVLPLDLAAP